MSTSPWLGFGRIPQTSPRSMTTSNTRPEVEESSIGRHGMDVDDGRRVSPPCDGPPPVRWSSSPHAEAPWRLPPSARNPSGYFLELLVTPRRSTGLVNDDNQDNYSTTMTTTTMITTTTAAPVRLLGELLLISLNFLLNVLLVKCIP